jgi:ATP-dependent DNA ligase
MLLVRSDTLPEGPKWAYELKLDGYRAHHQIVRRSASAARNNKSFDAKYLAIVQPLPRLPDETVIDGKVVALATPPKQCINSLEA